MEHDIILGIDTDKVNSRIEDCMANKADLVKVAVLLVVCFLYIYITYFYVIVMILLKY